MTVEEVTDQVTEDKEVVVEDQPTNEFPDEVQNQEADTDKEVEQEYVPDYSYKVYDEERQLPEWTKELVTNKEREDHFRSLHAKADAFEPMKSKYETLREKHTEVEGNYNNVYGRLDELQYYLTQGDLHTFFKETQIPEKTVIDYVKQLINYSEMPVEQRQAVDSNRQLNVQSYQDQQRALNLETQNANLLKQQHDLGFERAMMLPEVASFVKNFDAKMGVAGAFRAQADSYGTSVYNQTQKNPSPLEAVQQTMKQFGPLMGSVEGTGEQTLAEIKAERDSVKPGGTLPTVGKGRATSSPAKKRFMDLDALRKHVSEITGTDG